MKLRILFLVGLVAVGHLSTATAQPIPVPVNGDSRPKEVVTTEQAQKSHPDQIQAQLKLIAEQFAAAGLAEELRAVQELQRRVQGPHFQRLLATHREAMAKAVEPQIAMQMQMIELSGSPQTIAALSDLFSPAAGNGASKTPINLDSPGPLCGVIENAKAIAWIEAMAQQGNLKVLSCPKVTVLNGRTANVEHGQHVRAPSPIKNRTKQNNNAAPEAPKDNADDSHFVGVSLRTTAKLESNKLIKLSLTATHEDYQRNAQRVQSEIELRDGQTLVLAGLQSHGTSTEVSRIPILGDIPVMGPLFFSSKKSHQVTNLMMFVVTPEIVIPTDHPPVIGFEPAPVQPAKYQSPGK